MGRELGFAAMLVALGTGGGCYDGSNGAAEGAGTDDDGGGGDGSDGADDGVDDGADETAGADDGVPEDLDPLSVPEPLVTRLTDRQYRYVVLDVFGVELTAEEIELLPRDVPIEGAYSTAPEAQSFNAQYVLGYAYIARSLSERLAPADLRLEFAGCDGEDAACTDAFVAALGRRLFARPLTAAETEGYAALAGTIASERGATDADVVRGLVQALLQAPDFLYRVESETLTPPGEVRRIDGYELASRLSFFLWQSVPDQALLEVAGGPDGDGDFDRDAVLAEVERMVADPKFARARTLFWGDYSLASTSAFATTDPQLRGELRDSLLATFDLISGVGGEAQPLSAVFDGEQYVMTPDVAAIAGAASAGEGLQTYDAADTEARLGVVTHPAFLAAMGTTSFVGRGVFMTERLLCQHIAPPPADVAEQIMETAQMTEGLTPREASEFRFGLEPVCVGCHTQFEPISYAFERFDLEGAYAEADSQGRALYSDGVLPASGERPEIVFDDATELLAALGADPSIERCFIENIAEFSTGHPPHWAGDFLPDALQQFRDEGLTFESLVVAMAQSDQLLYVRSVAP